MIDKTVLINEPKTILLFIFKKSFFLQLGIESIQIRLRLVI